MDILVIGQSNASEWFHHVSVSTPHPDTQSWRSNTWTRMGGEGSISFANTVAAVTGEPVRMLNAAVGSTSLTAAQPNNWLATAPGSLYANMLAAVSASGLQPDAIIWIQGERDAQLNVSTQNYLDGLETLFSRLAADFGPVPVFLQPLILPQPRMEQIVSAQNAYVAAHPEVTLVSPPVELITRDALHFTPAGYNVLGDWTARAVLAELGHPSAPPIVQGTQSADALTGTAGADRIHASAGADTIDGGAGNDVLLGEQGNDRISGGAGNDLIGGGSGDDTIAGGAGADYMVGDTGADTFVFDAAAASGADRIFVFEPGVDKLAFDRALFDISRLAYNASTGALTYDADGSGPGAPQLVVTLSNLAAIQAGDIVYSDAAPPPPDPDPSTGQTFPGTSGVDTMTGTAGNDTFMVTAGDVLSDPGGIDHVMSGVTWRLGAGFENLTLTGTAQIDGHGNELANRIVGNGGRNVLAGNEGDDTVLAGAGDDMVNMSFGTAADYGRDSLDGGAGVDRINFGSFAKSALIIDLAAGTVAGGATGGGGSAQAVNFEQAIGGAFNDRFVGTAGNNYLYGNGGNDVFVLSAGVDTIDGAGGVDTLDASAMAAAVVVNLATSSMNGTSTIYSAETVLGSAFADALTGSTAANRFEGGGGDDTLAGGAGVDTLMGGAGSDRFDFVSAPGTANADRLLDFTSGSDKLRFDDAFHPGAGALGNLVAGDQRFWSAAGATTGHDATDRFVYNTTTGNLYYDADGSGSGAAQLAATLQPSAALQATDLVIV
jgi:Ca2+-binding RTX toxin-like protein